MQVAPNPTEPSGSRQAARRGRRFDKGVVKEAARGRWLDIIATIGGLDPAILDGRHHPCPLCQGVDRFRAFDDFAETGGVICNQCHAEENSDGISTLRWLRGWDFKQTVGELARFLGIEPSTNGRASRKKKASSPEALSDQGEWSTAGDSFLDTLLPRWCESKPPIRPEAVKALGAKFCRWPKRSASAFRCFALAGRSIHGDKAELAAILLYNFDAQTFPAFGSLNKRKTHLVKGSKESWIWAGNVEDLQSAEVIVKVEGPTDLLAILSVGLPRGWVVITNACGAKSTSPEKLDFTWAAGKLVIIVGDADKPGQEGARRFAVAFLQAGAREVRLVQLPYEVSPDHGKDLRDWLVEGHTTEDLVDLVEHAHVVTAEEATEWIPRCKPTAVDDSDALGLATVQGRTEVANAKRLATRYGHDVRWCDPWGKWLVWDGKRWAIDERRVLDGFAKSVFRSLWDEISDYAKSAGDNAENHIKGMIQFARQTGEAHGIEAMLKLARSEPGIAIVPDMLDTDPWLLNCENGILDLRTGELLLHRREDYLTKLCPVVFDPKADCPLWLAFLREIMGDDDALLAFLRRAVGMSLTGVVRDHVLFFLYGTGSNGKSTLVNAIQEMMGPDYAMKAPPDLLMAKAQEAHPTERADLAGKRFVACIEAGEGRRLAEALVKELTGADRLRARRMREDFWEFSPTHKIWLAANHKPIIRGTDWGIWRRVKLVPFTVRIPDDKQDKMLPDKLRAELAGILNWAVLGCIEWQSEGLGEPEAVRRATSSYRSDMDILGLFLDENCVIGDEHEVAAGALYANYKAWAERQGERHPLTQQTFGGALTERGFTRDRFTAGPLKGRYRWLGIGLHHQEEGK